MELFQRVKQVSKELAGSETKLASMLGLPTKNAERLPERKKPA